MKYYNEPRKYFRFSRLSLELYSFASVILLIVTIMTEQRIWQPRVSATLMWTTTNDDGAWFHFERRGNKDEHRGNIIDEGLLAWFELRHCEHPPNREGGLLYVDPSNNGYTK